MVSLADEIPMITKGESVLYKYAAGGDMMLLKYCNMLNIENQHLYDLSGVQPGTHWPLEV